MKLHPFSICLCALLAIAGTAIAEDTPATTFYTGEGTVVGYDFVGLVPGGLRLNSKFAGTVTDGLFAGSTSEGIDYVLIRPDFVMEMNAREIITIPDGPPVAVTIKGFWVPTMEMPPLEAMLDPDFEFADVEIPGHGAAWFETMAPQYAFLNHTVFSFTGTINIARGEIRLTYRSLAE